MDGLPSVCVIGAGVSGLTACKALADFGVPHSCFEASDEVGGNWYFQNPNGVSSAYRWLRDYADAFALRERIRFNTRVEHAERGPNGGWQITRDGGGRETFDALLV